ncbi:protein of unknown function [Chitinophaga jiangningensis]|uniref:DUF4139 domain-containing protein n=2 Tax=Chitinophaga jiangningensis TaxID=1419482 RepID=A0A1M6VIM4_9BACT|nr:protein of unknown function [Chitinophaga jiangningensis]
MQKDESRKNLLGSRVTFSRTWEITVKNNKGVPIKVNVEDQLPIKTISDMDISKTEYGDAALDAETNILTWQLHVAPATEQKRQLKYAITYPKGQIVNVN